ncbi:MAG: hypothetical protein ACI9WS_002005 [Paraglaciecola psychrophila]|jgi:hypothetical protein
MIKGHCLCAAICYQYSGDIGELAVCHCQQCKRAQGTAFVTNAPIETAAFEVVSGALLMRSYFSSPNKKRVFCSRCGSPLYSQRTDMPELIRLRVGTISEGIIPQPSYQSFCESRSQWLQFAADLPQYPQTKDD